MTTRLTRIQLIVFAVVTVLAVSYGTVNYFNVGAVLRPPDQVRAVFGSPGGIYVRADVDLLGTKVGTVREIVPGPGRSTTVVLALDRGAEVPRDVIAAIGNKSAIGEQYVELTPQSAGGPYLTDGAVIPQQQTRSPLDVADLLAHLDALGRSIPTGALQTSLAELSTGLDGVGGILGHMLDNSDRLSAASLAGVKNLTALIEDAGTVLDTQVEKGARTRAYLRELSGLMSRLRRLDPTVGDLFGQGIRAGVQVSGLLEDNQQALPVLLNQLVSLTTVFADRTAPLRKTLVVFPYALQGGATGVRRCGSYNPKTGKPIESTCEYDAQGNPIYSTYLGQQLEQTPGSPPYNPCTQGYGGTVKYQPDGATITGTGAKEQKDSPPNMDAGCTASPYDPYTPNVAGAQNVPSLSQPRGRPAPSWSGLGLYDPTSGILVTSDGAIRFGGILAEAPPAGPAGLAWLLNLPMD